MRARDTHDPDPSVRLAAVVPRIGNYLEALPLMKWAPLALLGLACTGQIGSFEMPGAGTGSGPDGTRGTVGATGGESTCTTESPSPRILRQLTRAEYGSTVADLLGIAN